MQNIIQEGSNLNISFNETNRSIDKLYIKNEYNSLCYEPIDDTANFKIDLNEVISVFKQQETNKLYLVVEESDVILTTQKNLKVNNANSTVCNLSEVTDGDFSIHPYITKNGFLHFSMTQYTPSKNYFSRRHIDSFRFNNHEAKIEGQCSIINSTFENIALVLGTRFTTRKKNDYIPSKVNY
ncbi:hypothetical protein [Staphylococcus sp. GDY8P179P]|uniref:hypothetical protein n=1 Tax=Staphylococcus sp. GDY8P179P TaxID=2804169 RepID=UPI001FD90167|nr:hypothetical protein [Staphylococcus sp. GDY8P179P]